MQDGLGVGLERRYACDIGRVNGMPFRLAFIILLALHALICCLISYTFHLLCVVVILHLIE